MLYQGALSFPTVIFHDFSVNKNVIPGRLSAGTAVTANAVFSMWHRLHTSNTCNVVLTEASV